MSDEPWSPIFPVTRADRLALAWGASGQTRPLTPTWIGSDPHDDEVHVELVDLGAAFHEEFTTTFVSLAGLFEQDPTFEDVHEVKIAPPWSDLWDYSTPGPHAHRMIDVKGKEPEYRLLTFDSDTIAAAVTNERLERRFNELADEWWRDTAGLSSVQDKILHGAYQRIIGMGMPALPLILRRLRDQGGFWFWALMAIADLDHDPADGLARHSDASEAWLRWGAEEELI